MKKNIFLICLCFAGVTIFAQKNSCLFFVDAFNSASVGFPSLRPGTADTLSSYSPDKKLFEGYDDLGLRFGTITHSVHLPSSRTPGKKYTEWQLLVYGKLLYPGDGITWEAAKDKYEYYFKSVCASIHDGCTSQLMMSPIFYESDDEDDLFIIYLYHPAITLPDDVTQQQAQALINESPYIQISFRKNLLLQGRYEITYKIAGITYEN